MVQKVLHIKWDEDSHFKLRAIAFARKVSIQQLVVDTLTELIKNDTSVRDYDKCCVCNKAMCEDEEVQLVEEVKE